MLINFLRGSLSVYWVLTSYLIQYSHRAHGLNNYDTVLDRFSMDNPSCESLSGYSVPGNTDKIVIAFAEEHNNTDGLSSCARHLFGLFNKAQWSQASCLIEGRSTNVQQHPLPLFLEKQHCSMGIWDHTEAYDRSHLVMMYGVMVEHFRQLQHKLKIKLWTDKQLYQLLKNGMLTRQSEQEIDKVNDYFSPIRKLVNKNAHRHVQQYLVEYYQKNGKFTGVFKQAYESLGSLVPHAVSGKYSKEESFVLDINEQSYKRNLHLVSQILQSNYSLIILSGGADHFGCESKYALHFPRVREKLKDTRGILAKAMRKAGHTLFTVTTNKMICDPPYQDYNRRSCVFDNASLTD